MRKVIAGEFVSLDGGYAGAGGPEEDPSGGFTLGGWTIPICRHQRRSMRGAKS